MADDFASTRRRVIPVLLLCGGLGLVLLAYANSFRVPFLFDDPASIVRNPTIRQLWPPSTPLSPPGGGGQTVEGRPVLNLSLAVDYATGGLAPWRFHVTNLVIHLLAGLVAFGLVRRMLVWLAPAAKLADRTWFAGAAALLWVLHPLQTESVTYVIQRAESLAALWLLLTLYGFVRGVQTVSPRWLIVSVATCLLGMATKETSVVAPVLVLALDRTWGAGSYVAALRQRPRYYAGLAATWLLLILLVIGAGSRGGTIGPVTGLPWWGYGLTQLRGVVKYMALAAWPSPLVFDYGKDLIHHAGEIVLWAPLYVAALTLAVIGYLRRSWLGFLGVGFFLLLAPSSSVVGGTRQMLAEHRMYLALLPLLLAVLGLILVTCGRRALPVLGLAAGALALLTYGRNRAYQSDLAIWTDTVAKRPGNAWAHNNLGLAYLDRSRAADAAAEFAVAIQLDPAMPEAPVNLGNAYLDLHRVDDALAAFQTGQRLAPRDPSAGNAVGVALLVAERVDESIATFRAVLALDPGNATTHTHLANALSRAGQIPEALDHYATARSLAPETAALDTNWGNALVQAGRLDEAIARYQDALRLSPNEAATYFNLGRALANLNRLDEAIAAYEAAIRLQPELAVAELNLGNALARSQRLPDAIPHYRRAVALNPGDPLAHYSLANGLLQTGGTAEALSELDRALQLQPDLIPARTLRARITR